MSSVSENFSVILFCGRWLPTKKVRRGRRNIRIWRADFEIERHCIFMAALSGQNNDQQHKFKQLAEADRQLTMGLDELPCLGLHSHSRHAFATRFARCWPVCRDGGIGRRSGLKIRRGQPLASSSLAPGTTQVKGGYSNVAAFSFMDENSPLSGEFQKGEAYPHQKAALLCYKKDVLTFSVAKESNNG